MGSLVEVRRYSGWRLEPSERVVPARKLTVGAAAGGRYPRVHARSLVRRRSARTRPRSDWLAEGPVLACRHALNGAEPSLPAAARRIPAHSLADRRPGCRPLEGGAAAVNTRSSGTQTRSTVEEGHVVQGRSPVAGSGGAGSGLLSGAHRTGPLRVHLASPLLETRRGWSVGADSTNRTGLSTDLP